MFQNEHYITRGVSAEIPFWIQMVLWVMIDAMEEPKDWLQVFRLKGEGTPYIFNMVMGATIRWVGH